MTKNLWWGYLHTEGKIQAKRYFDRRDLEDAAESPFVETYYGPFAAEGRDEAIKILTDHFAIDQLGNNAEPIKNYPEDDPRGDMMT